MATPITIRIPHQLGRVRRRRIETGFARLSASARQQRPLQRTPDGDRLTPDAAVMGQTIAGAIDVLDTAVAMEIELPGLLGMLASGLKDRLHKAATLLLAQK
jgi:hypothetical protein